MKEYFYFGTIILYILIDLLVVDRGYVHKIPSQFISSVI